MRTPREVLLNRHRSIEPKLSNIRQKVLNHRDEAESRITASEVPAAFGRFVGLFELFRPFRLNLAGTDETACELSDQRRPPRGLQQVRARPGAR